MRSLTFKMLIKKSKFSEGNKVFILCEALFAEITLSVPHVKSYDYVSTRETREGWPLPTVETEANGDSKSTYEGGSFPLVGCLWEKSFVFLVRSCPPPGPPPQVCVKEQSHDTRKCLKITPAFSASSLMGFIMFHCLPPEQSKCYLLTARIIFLLLVILSRTYSAKFELQSSKQLQTATQHAENTFKKPRMTYLHFSDFSCTQ